MPPRLPLHGKDAYATSWHVSEISEREMPEDSLKVIKSNITAEGSRYLGEHVFTAGNSVPLYEVTELSVLNQLVGYAKYSNKEYGNVYYRGVGDLYPNVMPALMRTRTCGAAEDLVSALHIIADDPYMSQSLALTPQIDAKTERQKKENKRIRKYNGYVVEAVLQHYSGSTRFLDLVDNHWIALWMGLHKFRMRGDRLGYCRCERRTLNALDTFDIIANPGGAVKFNPYLYILMIALPYMPHACRGVSECEEFVEVDLRKALPSVYLRPHAQHALVARRRVAGNTENSAEYFDMASQVVGIIRVRIDRAGSWIGEGGLMTAENLFPSPAVDTGYNTLLLNEHLLNNKFGNIFRIIRYF